MKTRRLKNKIRFLKTREQRSAQKKLMVKKIYIIYNNRQVNKQVDKQNNNLVEELKTRKKPAEKEGVTLSQA